MVSLGLVIGSEWRRFHVLLVLDGAVLTASRSRRCSAGFLSDASAFRPTLQVLPLALEILWEPLNFYGLLQFLTHPICSGPWLCPSKIGWEVTEKPGIGLPIKRQLFTHKTTAIYLITTY